MEENLTRRNKLSVIPAVAKAAVVTPMVIIIVSILLVFNGIIFSPHERQRIAIAFLIHDLHVIYTMRQVGHIELDA